MSNGVRKHGEREREKERKERDKQRERDRERERTERRGFKEIIRIHIIYMYTILELGKQGEMRKSKRMQKEHLKHELHVYRRLYCFNIMQQNRKQEQVHLQTTYAFSQSWCHEVIEVSVKTEKKLFKHVSRQRGMRSWLSCSPKGVVNVVPVSLSSDELRIMR